MPAVVPGTQLSTATAPRTCHCQPADWTTHTLGCRNAVIAGGPLLQQLDQAGVRVQQVHSKQQAADVRLSSDACNFAQAEGSAGCLVVVTGDTGAIPASGDTSTVLVLVADAAAAAAAARLLIAAAGCVLLAYQPAPCPPPPAQQQLAKVSGCRDRSAASCVSALPGFAPVLRYCTSRGVATLVITPLPSPRYLPELLPDARKHSLAAACSAAVPWQQQVKQATPRSPLSSSARFWHRLDGIVSAEGVLEPWMFTAPP